MSSSGPTMIIGDGSLARGAGRPDTEVSAAVSARLQRVADALDAGAAAAMSAVGSAMIIGVRTADPTGLNARRAAVAAALQDWSGTASGTLRTTALAVLAASRTEKVRQEATRAAHHPHAETVFEAFVRGVESQPAPQVLTGRGGWR
jgi:hypothetical protein